MTESMGSAPVRILIIEDNRGDVLLVREALREVDIPFELTHIADGEQAFEHIERIGSGAQPDIIVLDLNIPKRDGWEILEHIRQTSGLELTPVVIMSSSGNPEDRERAERTPNAMYIHKPSGLDEFLAIGKQIDDFRLGVHRSTAKTS